MIKNKKIKHIGIGVLTSLAVITVPISVAVSCGSDAATNSTTEAPTKAPAEYESKNVYLEQIIKGNDIEKQHGIIKKFIDDVMAGKVTKVNYKKKNYTRKDGKKFLEVIQKWTKEELIKTYPTLVVGADKSLIDVGEGYEDITANAYDVNLADKFTIPKEMKKAPKHTHYEYANDKILTDVDTSTGKSISHWTRNIGNFQRGQILKEAGNVEFKVRLVADQGFTLPSNVNFKLIFKTKKMIQLSLKEEKVLDSIKRLISHDGIREEYISGLSSIDLNHINSLIPTIQTATLVNDKGVPIAGNQISNLHNGQTINIKVELIKGKGIFFSDGSSVKVMKLKMKDMLETLSVTQAQRTAIEGKIRTIISGKEIITQVVKHTFSVDPALFVPNSIVKKIKIGTSENTAMWGEPQKFVAKPKNIAIFPNYGMTQDSILVKIEGAGYLIDATTKKSLQYVKIHYNYKRNVPGQKDVVTFEWFVTP